MPLFRFAEKLVLFVHIPKEAGGIEAMRHSAQVPSLPCTPQHFHADILARLIPPAFYDGAFTIIRNPYDRLASEYKMRVLAAGREIGFDAWVARTFERYGKNPFVNDNHIRPQSEFLLEGLSIFRFEQTPMPAIRDWLRQRGIELPAVTAWERRGADAPIRLSRATAAQVAAFYAADFQRLGYDVDHLGPSLVLDEAG